MTPEEAKKLSLIEFAKRLLGIDLTSTIHLLLATEPLTIDTIILIAPTKEFFLHFSEACRKFGWTRPSGKLNGNHVRASQHVKNHFEDYIICVARRSHEKNS